MKVFLKYQRLTVLWALFVFILCDINLGHVGESHLFFPGFDKLVHCGFFFMVVVLMCNGYIRQQNDNDLSYKAAAVVTVIAILYGGLIEILQATVFTWRTGSWDDLFADAVGAGMAIFSILVTIGAVKYVKK